MNSFSIFLQNKIIEKETKFYLANNKGVALVCEPYQGELNPYEEIEVKVTLYNDMCGKFDDQMIASIVGKHFLKIYNSLNSKVQVYNPIILVVFKNTWVYVMI